MKYIFGRFDTLSDAIIAIVMTILVLEVNAPTSADQLPEFVKSVSLFLISFILLINIWYRRAKIQHQTVPTKLESLFLDIFAHGLLSLFPLAIKMLVSYDTVWVSVLFYGLLNVSVITALNLIPIIELKESSRETSMNTLLYHFYRRRLLATIVLNLLIILAAYFLHSWGAYLYLVLPLVDFYASYRRDKRLDAFLAEGDVPSVLAQKFGLDRHKLRQTD